MPAVVESSKGRAKLFNTLNRSGAHFISIGSGSSSDSEVNDSTEGEQRSETSATQGGGKKAKAKHDRSRQQKQKLKQQQQQQQHQRQSTPLHSPPGGEVPGSEEGDSIMSVRYSRVTSGDGPSRSSSPVSEAEHSKRRRSQLAERISNKLHALLWIIVGIAVAYRTDFIRVLLEDDRVNRFWFNIGAVCFSVNVVILAYLTVWLPHVRGIKVSWNVYCPRAIPTATVVGLICALALNVALWNVWGFLTPLILFVVFIGCLFSLHFVPWPC